MAQSLVKDDRIHKIHDTFSYVVIYVYSIPLPSHKGRLKIGKATITSPNPSQESINAAAHERIKSQTKTADTPYNLEYAELAITKNGDCFFDTDVHNVLMRSDYHRKSENTKNTRSEWFEISLDIAKNAIQATKEGRQALTTHERITTPRVEFLFRPNQQDAIDKTTKAIKKNRKKFLWNAKMRFGKTSAAMQVAKENKMQKVLIVTHRPSVSADWYDDFNKVLGSSDYEYSSKDRGEDIKTLIQKNKSFVYFASLQDLRLSERIVQDESNKSQAKGFPKNDEVFDTTWDMVIIDEAHEGTQSDLGASTFSHIPTNFTLYLSGTPFNILHKQEEEDIYTWDYVMEQEAKLNWDNENSGIPNPYAELPALNIFTYDIDTFKSHIGNLGDTFHDSSDGAFKFHEFFRVHKDSEGNDTAEFVYESMVKKFLDLLVNDSLPTKFPYATQEYRDYNKHSLWLLPNRVKVIEAMERLLKAHPVFGSGNFGIVNISGNSRDEEEEKDAKNRVMGAIKNNEYTITLTGQRLTTGASIPQWTAVFMMSDTSSATTYLQTAFRCQTPAKINGKIKTQGYVFDFAPDRTLKLVAEAIELNHKSGKTNTPEQKEAMQQFLNFCPILAAEGGSMKPYDVGNMLTKLKQAIIDRVSRNGFDDIKLYNDRLLDLDEDACNAFNDLKQITGTSNKEKVNEIKVNDNGMDELKAKLAEQAEKKQKQNQELSEAEKEALMAKLKENREKQKQKQTAISILRAVSIRMPMLVYGANVSIREDITLQKFIDLVDEESWEEFMPEGLTKTKFQYFVQFYDEDVFKGVSYNIRAKAFDCDNLLPTERIQAIAKIFSTFKNPDKETVLTPWNVVNMHLTTAFGGHDFNSGLIEKTEKPEWKSLNVDTSIWEHEDTKILEINSKSGMYPLLAAYNVYSRKLKKAHRKSEEDISRQLWKEVLQDNIYVLCKSPMAKSITQRTLAGYNEGIKTNIVYIEDLIPKLQQKDTYKGYQLQDELLGKFNLDRNMKFTAIVGNPPYQEKVEGNTRDTPIYHLFIDESFKLSDKVSLITPARFLFNAGQTPKKWNQEMLHDTHLAIAYYEQKSGKVFPNTDIKGGVCIILWDKNSKQGGLGGKFIHIFELNTILNKVGAGSFDKIVFQNTSPIKPLNPKRPGDKKIRTNAFTELPDIFIDKSDENHQIKIIGLINNIRTIKYISRELLDDPLLDKWKVFLPKSNGSGALGEVLSTPLIGEPLIGCTQTFIQIGSFESQAEAQNCMRYIKTKFCRTLLGTLKITQDNPKSTWRNVPLQDFTPESDIDWSKSIPEIDQQLYKKYGLDQKEIDFIESHVKPMA